MFTVPALTYDYDALEGYISADIMQLHHDKHHQAYVDKLNAAIEKYPDLQGKAVEDLLVSLDTIPDDIRTVVRNNGGGHFNHSLFWTVLGPDAKSGPEGKLAEAINEAFGSLDALKEKLNTAGATRFGSGWAWLIVKDGKLEVTSSPNQDNPLMDVAEVKGTPIFGIDVWEHAYYLKYQNKRPDYLKAVWSAVNWDEVSKRYEAAL